MFAARPRHFRFLVSDSGLNQRGNGSDRIFRIITPLGRYLLKNPGQLLFVAGGYSTNDVDSDGVISEDEEGVHLFESYDASDIPEIWSAFEGKVAGESIICDKWGCFLSAFAPVYDKNGNVLAIVGVDISANISGKNITLFNSSILLFSMPFLSIFIVTLIIGIVLMRHIAHVENTNEQLKMLDKMKDSLIRDVSHELKTPLVTLQMSMSLLEENLIRNPPNKEYQKIRHTVADNINRRVVTVLMIHLRIL